MFDLDELPTESAMSRAWLDCLDDAAQTFITTATHYLVRKIHRDDMDVSIVRPRAEVEQGVSTVQDDQATEEDESTGSEINRSTRLARSHGFNTFDTERATNASYDDTRFLTSELHENDRMWDCSRSGPLSASAGPRVRSTRGYPSSSGQTVLF